MIDLPAPPERPTMYFVGVDTAGSSIMTVFGVWAAELGLDAQIRGIDVPIGSKPASYRSIVEFLRSSPQAVGALVTTHKLNLLRASQDLIDELDPSAQLTEEVSCLVSTDATISGYARDVLTGGLALAEVAKLHRLGAAREILFIGAGGATVAITCHALGADNLDVGRIYVADNNPARLAHAQRVHARMSSKTHVSYHLILGSTDVDELVSNLPPGAIVVNATGMGKDTPGSPLTRAAVFPADSTAWDLNYRGEREFLTIAADAPESSLVVTADGWLYFVHGWLQSIATVFDIDVPTEGPEFERLAQLAREARAT